MILPVFLGAFVAFGLYASSLYNYLLFHSLVELFSVLVAFVIFVLAWNTRRLLDSHYLLFIGIASLSSGALDLVHILAYKGMGVFPGYDANLATQLWIAFRSIFSVSLFLAPFFVNRKLPPEKTLAVFIIATAFLLASIFLRWFPDCFVEGSGLTTFKIVSEYVICLIFLAALVVSILKRYAFDRTVLKLMILSILSSVVSELSFTQYASVYGAANMAGHFFELLSYVFIYRAIVVTGVVDPSSLLFRNLKQSEDALKESETRFRSLFENMIDGFACCRMLFDDHGHPVDFVYLAVNNAFEHLTGLKHVVGEKVTEVIPGIRESNPELFEIYGRVASTGRPERFELYLEPLHTWLSISVYSTERGCFIAVFDNITERRQTEETLRRSHEELEKRVQERTEELVRANEELESEIVERIRTERQIEESQQKLLDTLESISDGFFNLDREWRFTYVNTELTRLWQRSREELIGRSLWDTVPGAVGSPFETEYRRAVREMTPVSFEALSPMLGIWVEARAYPSREGLSVHFHDITERKKSEENISRLNRLYSVLSKVNEAIVRIHDPKRLYERVCRIAVEDGQFKMGWIGLSDTDTLTVRPAASYGDSGGYLDGINISAAAGAAEGRGPTGTAVYEGNYSICGDIEHDPRMLPWRDKALQHGFRSSAAFPLRAGSTVIGAFTIYSSKPQFFTSEEIVLLNSLAEDLSFAIDSMNNEKMRLEAEESLRASSEEIRVLYDNSKVTNDLLQLFPRKFSRKEYLDAAAVLIRDRSGCRHVGMRIADNDGNIPYESCAGYNAQFLASESNLSLKHDRCVCTRVVTGTPEPHEPGVMTQNGSFYCNDTSKFMEGLTEGQRTQYRGVCMKHGFLSLAVVPIRYRGDRVIGAIHLADEREDMVLHKNVEFVEQLAFIVGEAVFRFGIEDELKTLNKELEQRVVQRTAQLEAANKELEAFAYSVSHDLRAPLRAIDGFSRVIEEEYAEKLGAAGRDHFRRVRAAGRKMAQLIDALLGLSRLTRGELHRTTVDLGVLARKTVDDLRSQDAGRTVEFVIPDGLIVEGDPVMLRAAVDNLLSNAWKFTSKTENARIEFGKVDNLLRISDFGLRNETFLDHVKQGKTVYYVQDNGAGFDMTYAKKLFTAFQRLHSAEEFPGLGIGLATVARIVHRHEGDIWAQGEVGKGATFYFTLLKEVSIMTKL
jgi:PAS domain S-box-containing protein